MTLAATSPIRGATDVYLVLGDPVEQVRAPESFNLIFARLGIDAVLVPVHISTEDLESFVRAAFKAPNIKGMWVTIPHKTNMTAVLDECTDLGRVAGAVNAVRRDPQGRLSGGLFDGEGFTAALDHFGIAWTGKKVLVIGAGGAAAAIGVSLAHGSRAAAGIGFFDPVPGKARRLAERVQESSCAAVQVAGSNDPAGYDLVINASPLGLEKDDPMPCDVARMESHAALVDILMKNQPTPAVRAARERGLVAQPGFEMLIQQAHLYLDFFGFHEAARMVRQDAGFLREQIYPRAMHGELRLASA